jgi:hypothetical protein
VGHGCSWRPFCSCDARGSPPGFGPAAEFFLLLAQKKGTKEEGLNTMRPNICVQGSADACSQQFNALSGC